MLVVARGRGRHRLVLVPTGARIACLLCGCDSNLWQGPVSVRDLDGGLAFAICEDIAANKAIASVRPPTLFREWKEFWVAEGSADIDPGTVVGPKRAPMRSFAPNEGEQQLRATLSASESEGTAVVDFGEAVGGDWSTVILVCDGTPSDALREAIGFDSNLTTGKGDLTSMVLFVGEDRVQTVIDSGNTAASKELWVMPCTPPAIQTEPQLVPVALNREEASSIQLHSGLSGT